MKLKKKSEFETPENKEEILKIIKVSKKKQFTFVIAKEWNKTLKSMNNYIMGI